MDLFFNNLSYTIKQPKTKTDKVLVDNVDCYIAAGTLSVIMGASGAGKTSLMDTLAGRTKKEHIIGRIGVLQNNNDVTFMNSNQSWEKYRQKIAYVMQDDVFLGNLTVRESILYSIELKLPQNHTLSKSQMEEKCSRILSELKLEKVKNSIIGTPLQRGISGGERRRLSIAMELVNDPKIIFLDEPTSGLDTINALNVIKVLKSLCSKYKTTIVCTIHQPSSTIFQLFDNLLIMKDGKSVYFGGSLDSLKYFGDLGYPCPIYMNPAEFILDIVLSESQEEPDINSSLFHDEESQLETKSNTMKTKKLDLDSSWKSSRIKLELEQKLLKIGEINVQEDDNKGVIVQQTMWKKTLILTRRTWINTIRDSSVMYVRTFSCWGIGLLVGFIYFNLSNEASSSGKRINALLFLMCVFSLFCLPAISRINEDRLLFIRERASCVSTTISYFLSTWIVEMPILFGMVLGYGCIVYWMTNMEPSAGRFIFFLFTVFLVVNVGFSLCQALASFCKSTNFAIAMFMVLLVYALLFGGFMMSASSLPKGFGWLLKTSYFNYGYEALILNEFQDKSNPSGVIWGNTVIQNAGMSDGNKWIDFIGLCCWFVGLRILALIGLSRR